MSTNEWPSAKLPAEPDAQPRALTLDEALAIAILLQKSDQLAEAQQLYARILDAAPDHPDALHYAGVLAQQQGRSDDAGALIERSLEIAPDRADWHSNLGIVRQAEGRLDKAIAAFRRAIALDPGHANAHSNLGVLLRATGRPVEAEEAYRNALRIDPRHIDALTNLGVLLTASKRSEEAVACFCKALTLRPKHKEARKLLALAHCTIGEVDAAAKIFEEWLDEEPENAIARHMLAACTGRAIPSRASNAFVAGTFDGFAASFEAKLARLSYRAPALVAAMIEDAGIGATRSLDVLDAGCGTGLCGARVASYARRLEGVDLSPAMLTHAEAKHLYDSLTQGELTDYLRARPAAFDLIVSADTLVYFGALDEVVASAAQALRPGGHFVFTLEHASGADAATPWRLELHGRYSHARAYVEGVLGHAGLEPTIAEADLRMESGAPVPGLVIRARKRRTVSPPDG